MGEETEAGTILKRRFQGRVASVHKEITSQLVVRNPYPIDDLPNAVTGLPWHANDRPCARVGISGKSPKRSVEMRFDHRSGTRPRCARGRDVLAVPSLCEYLIDFPI